MTHGFSEWWKASSGLTKIASAVSLFVVVAGALFFIYAQSSVAPLNFFNRPKFKEVFTLVNATVSESSNITIHTPESVELVNIDEQVSFTPSIKGRWIDSSEKNTIVFAPDKKLKKGRYYVVTVKTKQGVIGKDFYVVEDPAIDAVFPKENSEAHEDSEITIIFNRPMVALSSLDRMEEYGIPVKISPDTPGRFKWTSTRTLQFLPETTLIPSEKYTVSITDGFTTLDGLPIEPKTYSFTTRPIRYKHVYEGDLAYNKPFKVVFNQPFDIDRMRENLTVENTIEKKNVDVSIEYGTKLVYDKKKKENVSVIDESVLVVYNKENSIGQKRLWDPDVPYYLNIQKVYPKRGSIVIEEDRGVYRRVGNIIKRKKAISSRSSFVDLDFFDPAGSVFIEFFEDINLKKSSITGNQISRVRYAKVCENNPQNFVMRDNENCESAYSSRVIEVVFDKDLLNYGDTYTIDLNRIVNTEGLQINRSQLNINVTVVPEFGISKIIPGNDSENASVTQLILCSNTPIAQQSVADMRQYLVMDKPMVPFRWDRSVDELHYANNGNKKCDGIRFRTTLIYGLNPQTDYSGELEVFDEFNQSQKKSLVFKTGNIRRDSLDFRRLQKSYSVTTPERTKLSFTAENMTFMDLEICKVSPETMLRIHESGWARDDRRYRDNCLGEVLKDKIKLPEKYWTANQFQVDLAEYVTLDDIRGHYVLTFTNPEYKRRDGGIIYQNSYVTVTNLSVIEKKVELQEERGTLNDETKKQLNNLYWVVDSSTLEPVVGAGISLFAGDSYYYNSPISSQGTYSTMEDGIAYTPIINNLRGAVVTAGSDSAIVSNRLSKIKHSANAIDVEKFYMYTDRPIYRPGQKVFVKGIYRMGFDGEYDFYTDSPILLEVFDSKGSSIFKKDLSVSEYGTISDSFTIPDNAPLGKYRIMSKGNSTYFDVEEFVPSAFKVEVETEKEEYVAGDTVKVKVDADYYFGVPLESGEVTYSISAQRYYFDKFEDKYFRFGGPWYGCYWECRYDDTFVLRDTTQLGEDGTASIDFDLDFEKFFKEKDRGSSKLFTINVTIRNSDGQSVSSRKTFIAHRSGFYIGIQSQGYGPVGESVDIRVKTVDTEGKPRKIRNLTLTVGRVEWTYNKRKEVDGGYYYKSEKRIIPVKNMRISTNNNGDWRYALYLGKSGSYEVSVRGVDMRGNAIEETQNIYVYGSGYSYVRQTNDTSLTVTTDNPSVSVGETKGIVIESPFKKAKALITLERGDIYSYEVVDINQSIYYYEFDFTAQHIPSVIASVTLVSGDPDIKHGSVTFNVNTKEKELFINTETNKSVYLPGEEVSLDFEVLDSDGVGVESELSVAVVDLSVLALKGNPKKNPVAFYYGLFPHTVSTISNLKNVLYEVQVPSETKGGGGGGSDDLETRKRGLFKETAFWTAHLVTDENGRGNATFTLPDDLTTWQIETLGISKDTMVGVDYKEIVTNKKLMVTPLLPRFSVPGDKFALGAQVFNQTDSVQNVSVMIDSPTLVFDTNINPEEITLKPGDTQTVFFDVEAPVNMENGRHVFSISAVAGEYVDMVEKAISITRNNTYEAVATSGMTSETRVREYIYVPPDIVPDRGAVSVKSSATLAVFLEDSLNMLLSFPYGCAEQVASKLSTLAVVKSGLNVENIGDALKLETVTGPNGVKYTLDEAIEKGISKLYSYQRRSGMFSYYTNTRENQYLTMHVVSTLLDLKEAGYEIDMDVVKRAREALEKNVYSREHKGDYDTYIISLAYSLYRDDFKSSPVRKTIVENIKGIIKDDKKMNETLGNYALITLALLVEEHPNLFTRREVKKVYMALDNKIEIDARGAFLPRSENPSWRYHETAIKNTSLMIKAMAQREKDNGVAERLIRWLLRNKNKDGSWGSTGDTKEVVGAMVDYINWKKENQSKFDLELSLNGDSIQRVSYAPESILNQNEIGFSTRILNTDELNEFLFDKTDKNRRVNNFYYDVSMMYYIPIDNIEPRDEGFSISRLFYRLDDTNREYPVTEAKQGDVLKGVIKIISPRVRNFVAVEDFIPAGFELINFNLSTSDKTLEKQKTVRRNYWYRKRKGTQTLDPDHTEFRDDRLFLYDERLNAGVYEYEYFVRALIPGTFNHLPAVVSEWYFPENFGRTGGGYFEISKE